MTEAAKVAARMKSKRALTVLGLAVATLWYFEQRALHGPRLVGYELESSGECSDAVVAQELPNWSGKVPLRRAFQMQRAAGKARAAGEDPKVPGDLSLRKPDRMIRDPYAAYSAVAVDASHDEVVMTDENRFNILAYDRMTNTRPASVSDPKRIIGGLDTKIEFQCGLYVDPANGDIYAVNNDTVDDLVIFSRQAVGDVRPDRELHTPHGTFGIAVDENTKELFLSVQHDNALVVYDKTASGAEAPIRVVQGSHTGLADPHGLALDAKKKLLYVTNHGSTHDVAPRSAEQGRRRESRRAGQGFPLNRDDAVPGSGRFVPPSITVYAEDAKGDAAPVRTIQGPKTQFNWPTGLALDLARNELFVANDGGSSILVFDASASGDVAPLRVIKGPKSLVSNPTGVFFDEKNQEIWAANFGNHTATVYKRQASGDAEPLRVIRSAKATEAVPGLGNPHPIAFDTKRQQLLVPN
jgi:DNA-binding beta-propeller fold protein YncE